MPRLKVSPACPSRLAGIVLVLGATACGTSTPVDVSTDTATETTATETSGPTTTSPSSTTSTTVPGSTSTPTATTTPNDDLVPVDPETLFSADDITRLAQFSPIVLPTMLPEWAAHTQAIPILEPTSGVYGVGWDIDYPGTTISSTLITLERSELEPESESIDEIRSYDSVSGAARDYFVPPGALDCEIEYPDYPPDNVLVWIDGNVGYSVSMVPLPGCAPGITFDQAIGFADSLVTCTVAGTTLDCEPEPQG
jgi:hypothetical protein